MSALISILGCSTETCTDPAHAGFFGGLANIASSCYERQAHLMQDQVTEAAARRDAMRVDSVDLQARAQALSQEKRELALKVATAQRDLADASRRLDAVRRTNASQTAEVVRLRAKQSELKQELDKVAKDHGSPQNRPDIDRLVAENHELAAQIDRFIRELPVRQ
jgi:chromosome segregation ATPase